MDAERSVRALGMLRIAIGVVSWVAPDLAGKLFGLDVKRNRQAPYLARLFGIRDLALGVGTLRAQGQERKAWLAAGVVCDTADTAAAKLGHRDGYLPTSTAALVALPAVAATVLGVIALREAPKPPA